MQKKVTMTVRTKNSITMAQNKIVQINF
jgi:hypothetical protein